MPLWGVFTSVGCTAMSRMLIFDEWLFRFEIFFKEVTQLKDDKVKLFTKVEALEKHVDENNLEMKNLVEKLDIMKKQVDRCLNSDKEKKSKKLGVEETTITDSNHFEKEAFLYKEMCNNVIKNVT